MAHLSGVAAFFIIVALVAVIAGVAWIAYTHLRARKLGLPQPTISSYNPFASGSEGFRSSSQGGVSGWISNKVSAFKNRNNRSAGGAYEEPLSSNVRGRGANRGFGPLDPDEAWDARVGTEADGYGPGGYYEEQEVGLHGEEGEFISGPGDAPRGRTLNRMPEPYIGGSQAGLDRRYDEEMGARPAANPFDDSHEANSVALRGVSPRPIEAVKGERVKRDDSSSKRHSVFHENM